MKKNLKRDAIDIYVKQNSLQINRERLLLIDILTTLLAAYYISAYLKIYHTLYHIIVSH